MQRRKDGAPEQELPGTLHTSPAANANKSMNVFSSVALHSPRRQPGFLGSCSDFFRLVTVELLDSVPYPRMEHWCSRRSFLASMDSWTQLQICIQYL
uniref:uncharacterized protein LOC143314033 isoform X7 n=1 Tax=Arvicanthis niloticus TaxID=61156 RepID=UPI00402B29A2